MSFSDGNAHKANSPMVLTDGRQCVQMRSAAESQHAAGLLVETNGEPADTCLRQEARARRRLPFSIDSAHPLGNCSEVLMLLRDERFPCSLRQRRTQAQDALEVRSIEPQGLVHHEKHAVLHHSGHVADVHPVLGDNHIDRTAAEAQDSLDLVRRPACHVDAEARGVGFGLVAPAFRIAVPLRLTDAGRDDQRVAASVRHNAEGLGGAAHIDLNSEPSALVHQRCAGLLLEMGLLCLRWLVAPHLQKRCGLVVADISAMEAGGLLSEAMEDKRGHQRRTTEHHF
mmetsp:Transcript_12282/g.35307  ORF Transcript_12282/g.35307 Transcript_12282/m.35307 type:complete len:284 (+) Transcript_12282:437-1288(+)